jgi:nucleotide-binding universal stress UspA family protein
VGTATTAAHTSTLPVADLNTVSDIGADLLEMGGYGHTRPREMLLDGTTRLVLRHMTVPVLMSH